MVQLSNSTSVRLFAADTKANGTIANTNSQPHINAIFNNTSTLEMFPVKQKKSVNRFAINRSETEKMAANWRTSSSNPPRIVQDSKSLIWLYNIQCFNSWDSWELKHWIFAIIFARLLHLTVEWLGMRGIPVSEKYRDIKSDGIIYRVLAKYHPQHST